MLRSHPSPRKTADHFLSFSIIRPSLLENVFLFKKVAYGFIFIRDIIFSQKGGKG